MAKSKNTDKMSPDDIETPQEVVTTQKNDCSKHKRLTEAFPNETAETLARKIADLHYEDWPAFFGALSKAIKIDGHKDSDADRTMLGTLLDGLGESLKYSCNISKEVWKVCKPYMVSKRK